MTVTTNRGEIVPAETQKRTLAGELVKLKPEIAKALPSHLDAERMTRIALTALRTTPNLNQCTLPSFLGSVLTLAQLGLEPNTPLAQAYLIPRKSGKNGAMQCTTMLGYAGMLDIVYRSGKVALVYAEVVREGDVFDYDLGLDRKLIHKPVGDEDATMTHVYAVAELMNGHKAFVVLTASQVNKRKLSAQGTQGSSSPWNTFPEEMWKKSAVRALWKYLPRSPEIAQAVSFDEAPEFGKRQTEFLTPEVREALVDHGVDVEGDETPEQVDEVSA